ncbi:hypothetical protein PLESTB_000216300 [Pleodorina starrii]|uniref:Uncharacterized protein n=1 Tax=Pleodorina starrii TaxID=330485 RepID=A0A9W6EYM9_9CHLO|nr:hypothetical protein PLESTB_000216300 [Pleodorina starrii]
MPQLHHQPHALLQQQHRHTPLLGTSWPSPCTSPPSPQIPTTWTHSLSTSPTAPSLRGNLLITHSCAGGVSSSSSSRPATCHSSTFGGFAATLHHITSPASAPRRSAGSRTPAPEPTACSPPYTAAPSGTSQLAASSAACSSPLRTTTTATTGAGASHRWPAPARCRVRAGAVAQPAAPAPPAATHSAGSAAAGAGAGPGGGAAAAAAAASTRPPSPPLGLTLSYFEGFCPEGATECSPVWEQLRWCSTWQQMRQVYDNLLRAEAAETALAAKQAIAAAAAGGGAGGAGGSAAAGAGPGAASLASAPGLLSRDETYAFLLQLQDFYHLRLEGGELGELQAFRCRLVRDLSVYVRTLNAEQLEAMCCASAVSGQCLTRESADAVQQRLLKILTRTSAGPAHTHGSGNGNGNGNGHAAMGNGNGHANGNGKRTGNGNGNGGSGRRAVSPGGFQVLTPALNTIFALYDHGYLPQVALLQAVFRQAVDHCGEVTRSQWHGLHGLARRFRFLLDDTWLEDLHAHLREPLWCAATDFGRTASILGCISAFTANGAMEALDTRVLVIVEAIERRYDEGRSLLTSHQLVVFTALLLDMSSPFRSKWLGACLDHLASCRSHLAGLPPATLLLAVELVLRGRGWDEQRLLTQLLRHLFATYAQHPTAALRSPSNVAGCPPRAASRIISNPTSSSPSSTLPPAPSLSSMAAAAAWDVDVGGAGGAASPSLDLASLIDWLASKVPAEPGPERSEALELLQPLVSGLVEGGREQLASLDPRAMPGLIRGVSQLGVSPSREWVAEAFHRVAGGAAGLSGGELVAMLRLSHAQALPLPHATLDAVCAQHARILPLMRAVDLQRLLECWVADRYIPSREQLEGFFDAVCDAFGIDLAALKKAATGGGGGGAAAAAAAAVRRGSLAALTSMEESFDTDSASLPASAANGGGGGGGGGWSSQRRAASQMDLELLQAAGGSVSAGAADGVAGSFRTRPTAGAGAPAAAAATAAAAAAAAVAADAAAAAAAAAAASESQFKVPSSPSLDSLDGRPKGSLLQPEEAQSMLSLLDQYRYGMYGSASFSPPSPARPLHQHTHTHTYTHTHTHGLGGHSAGLGGHSAPSCATSPSAKPPYCRCSR